MTMKELMESDKEMLTPTDVAPILGCAPYSINVQCNEDPSKLGFSATLIGRNVKIPRRAFIKWLTGEAV